MLPLKHHTWSSKNAEYFLKFFYWQDTIFVIVKHFEELLKFIKICLVYSKILQVNSHNILDDFFFLFDASFNMWFFIFWSPWK